MEENLGRKLDPWCLSAKTEKLRRGLTDKEIAADLEYSRMYVSQILNGITYSKSAREKIGTYLGLK